MKFILLKLWRFLTSFFRLNLWKQVAIGMVLAIIVGHQFPAEAIALKPLGKIYLRMIYMVVIPLIFFSILYGVTSIGDTSTLGRVGLKAFLAYSFTSAFAVCIGLTFANIFNPGIGTSIVFSDEIIASKPEKTVLEILIDIIPSNPIMAMSNANTIQVVFFAFFTGIALIHIGEKGRMVKNFIVASAHLVFKMMEFVMKVTPFGVFGIMAGVVGEFGIEALESLVTFIITVMLALTTQYFLFGVMIFVFARLNPWHFYKKILPTQALAFATSSSKATLGMAMRELRTKMGVSQQSYSFVLPLGASINMDATSIYLGIVTVFFAQIFGIPIGFNEYIIIVLTCTIGSIGAAGFPGGSMVMMSMVLSSVGIPLQGIGLILGVDRFLEMFRTAINITGDCTITLIIDKSEKALNETIYKSNNIDEDDFDEDDD